MKKTMTVGAIVDLGTHMNSLAEMPKNPLKFCIIRNVKKIEPIISKFQDQRDELFNSLVKTNESGNACVKEEHEDLVKELSENGKGIPWTLYEFLDSDSEEKFFNGLQELLDKKKVIELKSESLKRKIKVSDNEGGYSECSVEEILEDPANKVDINVLSILIQNGILKD